MADEPEAKPAQSQGENTTPEQTLAQSSPPERTEITLASNTLADVRSSLDILPDDMFKGARPEQRTQQGERLPQADSPEAIIRQLQYIGQHREKLDTLVQGMFKAFSPEGNNPGNMDQAKNAMSEILRLLPPEKRAMFGKWAKCLDAASKQEQNPETARQLKELSENLKVLEKAPGFMRGNLALAMYQWAGQGGSPEEIRLRLTEAQKAMQDTVQNYPGLADDPNFKTRAQAIEQQYGSKLRTAAPATDGAEVHNGIMERVAKITQDIREGKLPLLYNPDAPQITNPDVTNPSVVDKPAVENPQTNPLLAIAKGEQAYAKYRQAVEAELAKGTPLEVAARAALTPEVIKGFEDSIAAADASPKPDGMANARFLQMLAAQRTLEQRTQVDVDGQKVSWAQANDALKQSFGQYIGTLQLDDTQKGQVKKYVDALDSAKSAEEYNSYLQNFQQFLNSNQVLKPLLQDSKLQQMLIAQNALKTPMYPYLQQLASAERMVQAEDSRAFNRSLYASALIDANQGDQAKKHLTDAYARVINSQMRDEIARQAIGLGTQPAALIDAAITRHENQPANNKEREPVPPISELLVDMQKQFDSTVQNLSKTQNGDTKKAAAEALKIYGPLFERMAKVATANRTRIEQMEQPLMADIKNQFALILQGTGPQGQEILNLQQKVFGAIKDPSHVPWVSAMLAGDQNIKAQVTADMKRIYGDAWVRDFEQWRTMAGDKVNLLYAQETRKTVYDISRNDSQMEQFGSRRLYAKNLFTAGDVAGAKTQLSQGLQEASAQVQGEAALSPEVQTFARQIGVDMTPYAAKIPNAPSRDQVIPGQDREIQRLQGIPQKAALDPRFAQLSDSDLQKKLASLISKSENGSVDADLAKQNIAEIKPLYEEFIRRSESIPHPDNPSIFVTPTTEQIFEGIKNKFDIIKAGVDPTTQRPLTELQRVQLYSEVLGSMDSVRNSILLRQNFSTVLMAAGQMQDAERVLKESKAISDKINRGLALDIMIKARNDINDPTIMTNAPLPDTGQNRGDLLNAYLSRLEGDHPSNNFANSHIMTRVALGRFYLGPSIKGNDPAYGAIVQYGNKAGIRPDLAYENLKEAKDLVFNDRNVNILDKNKFLDDVNLSSALTLAHEILPSELTSKLGMNESSASLMVNVLSAAAGIMWMRYTKGRLNEIPGLNPYTRLAGAVLVPTAVRNISMNALGEKEGLFTSTRNALASTLALSVGYKMMVRGESSNFRMFEGIQLPSQVSNLPSRLTPYLEGTRIPGWTQNFTSALNRFGRPMDNFGPLESAAFVERMNHSVGTFAQLIKNQTGEKGAKFWKPFQELAEAAGPNIKFSDLMNTPVRRPLAFAENSFTRLKEAFPFLKNVTAKTSLDEFVSAIEKNPQLRTELGKEFEAIQKLALDARSRGYRIGIEVSSQGIRTVTPGRMALEDAFTMSGVTHETLATVMGRSSFEMLNAGPLAQRLGTIETPFAGLKLRTVGDLKTFTIKAYEDLSKLQGAIASVEARKTLGLFDNLEVSQALRTTNLPLDEIARLQATADFFGVSTRGQLKALLNKFSDKANSASVLFPQAFKEGVSASDDLVNAALKNPQIFDGPMRSYLLARIPKAELAQLESAFTRQPAASALQVFERANFLNSGKTIIAQSELRTLYQNAFAGLNKMTVQLEKVTSAAADDSLETVFGAMPNSGITTEMIAQARSIGITNYGQLKSFVEKYGRHPNGFTLENTFSKLYPNLELNAAGDISLSQLLRTNPKALSGEGYSMITASVSSGERQLLGTSSVLSDTVSVNNRLFTDRLANANIRTIEEFRIRLGESLGKQLEPLKKVADFSTLSPQQRSLLDSLGLKNASDVEVFLAKINMPDVALEKLFPRLFNVRGPGGEVLSEPLLNFNKGILQDLATTTPNLFSGNGLRLLGDNVDLGLSFTLAGQRAQSLLNTASTKPLANVWSGITNGAMSGVNGFRDWFRITKLDPQTATLQQIARSPIAHSYWTGVAALGTYRTLVSAPNNMEAGDNLAQALLHAHSPETGSSFFNLLVSTPGAALFMPLLVRGGYMSQQLSVAQRFKDYGLLGPIKSPALVLDNPIVDLTRQGLSRAANSTSLYGTPLAATVAFAPSNAWNILVGSYDTYNRFNSKGPYLAPGEIRNMYVRTRDNGYQNMPINGEYISLEDYRQRNGIPKPEPLTVAPLERRAPVVNDIYKVDTSTIAPRAALDAAEQQRLQAQADVSGLDQAWAPHIEAMRKVETAMLGVQQASYLARLNEAAVTLDAIVNGQPIQGGAKQLARVAEVLQSIASQPDIAQNPQNQALIASMGQVCQALTAASTSGDMSLFAQAHGAVRSVNEVFKQHKMSDEQIAQMQTAATTALIEARAIAAQYQQHGSDQSKFLLSELGKADQNIKLLGQSIFGQPVTFAEITPQMLLAKADNPQINQLCAELAKFESLQNMKNASSMLSVQAAVTTTNNVTVASVKPEGLLLGPNATPQDLQAFSAYQSFLAAINNRDFNASPEATLLAQSVTPSMETALGNDPNSNEILRLLQDAAGKGDTDAAYQSLKAAARIADSIDMGSLASKLVNNTNPESQAALQMQAQLAGIAKLKYAQMAYRRQDYSEAQAYLIKARVQYGDQLESMLKSGTILDQSLDLNGFLTGAFTQMKKDANYDPAAMGTSLTSFFTALEKGNFGAKAEDGTPGAQVILTQVKDAYAAKKQAVERAIEPLNQQENLLRSRLQALGVPYENREAFLAGETNKTSEKYLQIESINRELKWIETSRNVRNQELNFDYNRMRLAEGLYDAAQGNYASANMILKEVKQNCPQLAAIKELDLDSKISNTEPGMWGWTKRNWQAVTMFGAGLAATVAGAVAFTTIVGSVPGAGAMTIGVGLMGAALAGAGTAALINGGVTLAVTRDSNQALQATYSGAKEGAIAGLVAPIGILGKLKPLPAIANPRVPSIVTGTYNTLRPATYAIGAGSIFAANDTMDRLSEKSWGTALTEFGARTLLYSSMFQFFGSRANKLADASITRLPFTSNLSNAARYAPLSYFTGVELTRGAGDVFQKSVDLVNDPYKYLTGSEITNNRFFMSEGQSFIMPSIARFLTRDGMGLDPNYGRDLNWIKRNHTQVMKTGDSFWVLKQQGFNAQNFVPSISYGPLLRR